MNFLVNPCPDPHAGQLLANMLYATRRFKRMNGIMRSSNILVLALVQFLTPIAPTGVVVPDPLIGRRTDRKSRTRCWRPRGALIDWDAGGLGAGCCKSLCGSNCWRGTTPGFRFKVLAISALGWCVGRETKSITDIPNNLSAP